MRSIFLHSLKSGEENVNKGYTIYTPNIVNLLIRRIVTLTKVFIQLIDNYVELMHN